MSNRSTSLGLMAIAIALFGITLSLLGQAVAHTLNAGLLDVAGPVVAFLGVFLAIFAYSNSGRENGGNQ